MAAPGIHAVIGWRGSARERAQEGLAEPRLLRRGSGDPVPFCGSMGKLCAADATASIPCWLGSGVLFRVNDEAAVQERVFALRIEIGAGDDDLQESLAVGRLGLHVAKVAKVTGGIRGYPVLVIVGVVMIPRRGGVRRAAVRVLMDVDGVQSRLCASDAHDDSDALVHLRQLNLADECRAALFRDGYLQTTESLAACGSMSVRVHR